LKNPKLKHYELEVSCSEISYELIPKPILFSLSKIFRTIYQDHKLD
jgi:hypothetical protein